MDLSNCNLCYVIFSVITVFSFPFSSLCLSPVLFRSCLPQFPWLDFILGTLRSPHPSGITSSVSLLRTVLELIWTVSLALTSKLTCVMSGSLPSDIYLQIQSYNSNKISENHIQCAWVSQLLYVTIHKQAATAILTSTMVCACWTISTTRRSYFYFHSVIFSWSQCFRAHLPIKWGKSLSYACILLLLLWITRSGCCSDSRILAHWYAKRGLSCCSSAFVYSLFNKWALSGLIKV